MSHWIWRSCEKQSRWNEIFLLDKQKLMMSQEGFNKYSWCWESPLQILLSDWTDIGDVITLWDTHWWCHHLMFSGPEMFTPIFLQFLPKTKLAMYNQLLSRPISNKVWCMQRRLSGQVWAISMRKSMVYSCTRTSQMFVLLVNVQEWQPHCTGMVAKFLFVSKCPGIGAALHRNGIISILFSTIQLFKIET